MTKRKQYTTVELSLREDYSQIRNEVPEFESFLCSHNTEHVLRVNDDGLRDSSASHPNFEVLVRQPGVRAVRLSLRPPRTIHYNFLGTNFKTMTREEGAYIAAFGQREGRQISMLLLEAKMLCSASEVPRCKGVHSPSLSAHSCTNANSKC